MDIFKVQASYYRTHKDTEGVAASLESILMRPRPEHINLINQTRAIDDEAEQKRLKSQLPGFTPAALLTTRASDVPLSDKVKAYTGFMQFDIDEQDNPGMDARTLRDKMARIPVVAFVQLSVRGRGVWGLVRIKDPAKMEGYYNFFAQTITASSGIRLDTSKGKKPTDLRYISYDPDSRVNPNAIALDATLSPAPARPPQAPIKPRRTGAVDDVALLVDEVVRRRLDVMQDYDEWFAVGSAFARVLGEPGRDSFHAISQFSDLYTPEQTDKDYSYWIKYSNNRGEMGAFFNFCKRHNIYATDLRKNHPRPLPRQTPAKAPIRPQETRKPEPAATPPPAPRTPATADVYQPPLNSDGYPADWDVPLPPGQENWVDGFPPPEPAGRPTVTLGPYPENYDRKLIADILDNPNNYTTGEALHTILRRVYGRKHPMTTHAVYDYFVATGHPNPGDATYAALKSFKKWWNWGNEKAVASTRILTIG
jgi:hypothetical protein